MVAAHSSHRAGTARARRAERRGQQGGAATALVLVTVVLALMIGIAWASQWGACVLRVHRADAYRDLARLRTALIEFARENGGAYPEQLECLAATDVSGHACLGVPSTVPLDPWKNPYQYECLEHRGRFRLACLGKDGRPGGVGDDADICCTPERAPQ